MLLPAYICYFLISLPFRLLVSSANLIQPCAGICLYSLAGSLLSIICLFVYMCI
ncbi:hypothetical protein BX070DRAFT_223111 [Coemansia spiralis]|nr:hypothetical protein BX070DRAFT_223111 [Coemansia spiralis]